MAWSTDPLWQARVVNNALDDNNTDYHYLHTDHLYTPMLATDEAGGISWNAVRDAFGATAVLPGNRISMPLRLPGQYFDPERGEHYNLLRDYQPTTGRYLQTDPIGLAGGINQYGYAYANPLSYSDPTGEVPLVAVAWAYGHCVASCTAIDAVMGGMGMACTTLSNTAKNCAADCLNPFNWAGGKKFKAANVSLQKKAQREIKTGKGPREITRIDRPEESVPKSQWHAHGKNGGALNQDGSFHDGDPKFSGKTKKWLESRGWNINK